MEKRNQEDPRKKVLKEMIILANKTPCNIQKIIKTSKYSSIDNLMIKTKSEGSI